MYPCPYTTVLTLSHPPYYCSHSFTCTILLFSLFHMHHTTVLTLSHPPVQSHVSCPFSCRLQSPKAFGKVKKGSGERKGRGGAKVQGQGQSQGQRAPPSGTAASAKENKDGTASVGFRVSHVSDSHAASPCDIKSSPDGLTGGVVGGVTSSLASSPHQMLTAKPFLSSHQINKQPLSSDHQRLDVWRDSLSKAYDKFDPVREWRKGWMGHYVWKLCVD
jgi:hypothetical protein